MSHSLVLLKKLKQQQKLDEFRLLTPSECLTGFNPFMNESCDYTFGEKPEDVKQWLCNLDNIKVTDKYNKYTSINQFELGSVLPNIFPKCRENHLKDYIILRGMKKTMDYTYNGAEVIKVVLQRKSGGELLFLTGINTEPDETNVPAVADGWHVFKARMVAPVGFWEMVRDCL